MAEVHVAVGVILNEQGEILISRRHRESHQGGLWEFPGGKVETGETVETALARELEEELGIRPEALSALVEVRHDYGDKRVFLDVWLVETFTGEPLGREGQPLAWCKPSDLTEYEFPAANVPIVEVCLELGVRPVPR